MPVHSSHVLLTLLLGLSACGNDLSLPAGAPGDGPIVSPDAPADLNHAPAFTAGPDQEVASSEKGSEGERDREVAVEHWATDIVPGPASEAGQAVSFLVDVLSGQEVLAGAPSIDSSGTLRYTPAKKSGSARVEVRLREDGGTADGGLDTSPAHVLVITVSD
jgi:hypothetical protein